MAHQERPVEKPRPTACSAKGADLNSYRATRLPTITFKPSKEHDSPVVVMRALNPLGTCMIIKEWLYSQLSPFLEWDSQFLRIEPLELSLLESKKTGSLILLEGAAKLEDVENKGPQDGISIAILALLMYHDPRVRFFYVQGPITPLLELLASEACIGETACMIKPKSHLEGKEGTPPDHHCRIYTWLQEAFLSALAIPDHQDYANAMSLTDYSPEINDSEADPAMRRIESCETLYSTRDGTKDLNDDRYVFALHPAGGHWPDCWGWAVEICAFKDDVLQSEKNLVKENAKVRTNYAHAQWLEKVYDWKITKAKRLVAGWSKLGLLEENRIRPWIRSGGQFEFGDHYEDE